MKSNHKTLTAALAGLAIGAAGATAIHAQQNRTPPGFVVAELDVSDPATFQKYAAQVPGTQAPFNARYLVRGGKIHPVEGEPPKRIVITLFDSAEKALEWENSPAYEAIKPLRHSSAKSRIYVVEGVAPQ